MMSNLYKFYYDLVLAFLGHPDKINTSNMNSPAKIEVEFEDGYGVSFLTNNLIEEYIQLRLMWHSTSDMFELIPYINTGFHYRIRFED